MMRFIKRLVLTVLCAILSKVAQSQVQFPIDTIYMHTKEDKLYLDSTSFELPDTLYARNESGRFEEQALTLRDKKNNIYDTLSMCMNRTTPNKIQLIRIGNNYFRIGSRIVVKIDERTLKAFANSFEYPRHCDHASHASHVSHYSSTHESHYSHYSSSK